MVHNEYGKRDLDIANNARMSNSLDPNSRHLFNRGQHKQQQQQQQQPKKKKKHQPKIVFKTTLPK